MTLKIVSLAGQQCRDWFLKCETFSITVEIILKHKIEHAHIEIHSTRGPSIVLCTTLTHTKGSSTLQNSLAQVRPLREKRNVEDDMKERKISNVEKKRAKRENQNV